MFVADAAVGMDSLISAMGTAFGTIKDDMFSVLSTALPIALAIIGAGLAITFGIKYFKKLSGNRGS